jgi:hypothetical protein
MTTKVETISTALVSQQDEHEIERRHFPHGAAAGDADDRPEENVDEGRFDDGVHAQRL